MKKILQIFYRFEYYSKHNSPLVSYTDNDQTLCWYIIQILLAFITIISQYSSSDQGTGDTDRTQLCQSLVQLPQYLRPWKSLYYRK